MPKTSPVHGTVLWQGQAVTHGRITFYPQYGRPASGQIQSDGSYALTTFTNSDGAIPGKHVVTIEVVTAPDTTGVPVSMRDEARRATEGRAPRPTTVEWLVPAEFSRRSSSPLTAEVMDSDNATDFELP